MREDRVVPNFWVQVKMSPPVEQLKKYKAIAEKWGGELREEQIYRNVKHPEIGYVLVQIGDDSKRYSRMLGEMEAGPATVQVHDLQEATEADEIAPGDDSDDDEGSAAAS